MRARLPTLLVSLVILLGAPAAAQTNLVQNPGFEDGASGWSMASTFKVISGTAHSGARSLCEVNNDPKLYNLATQSISFEHGRSYRIGAWIMTAGVQGADTGASMCLEWSGPNGWIGGTYLHGIKGDNDWIYIQDTTPGIPADATRLTVKLYMRAGMTGTAWWDDVSAVPYSRPFDATILAAGYRGTLRADDPKQRIYLRALVPLQVGNSSTDGDSLQCDVLRGADLVLSEFRDAAQAG